MVVGLIQKQGAWCTLPHVPPACKIGKSCTGPPVFGSTPRMVVPVKTRRGSQMNLKGLYRLNQNCMLKVHLSNRRAHLKAQYVAVHRLGGTPPDMKVSRRQGIWQCDKHVMMQPRSQPCSDRQGWARQGVEGRCNALPSLAPDFVLHFWTLPEVMDLCRRRKQVQGGC